MREQTKEGNAFIHMVVDNVFINCKPKVDEIFGPVLSYFQVVLLGTTSTLTFIHPPTSPWDIVIIVCSQSYIIGLFVGLKGTT